MEERSGSCLICCSSKMKEDTGIFEILGMKLNRKADGKIGKIETML